MKKIVVYLLGAGASQAAVGLVDDGVRLLMRDITAAIQLKIRKQNDKELDPIANDLLGPPGVDVERLITLFESSGVYVHARLAKTLRGLFYEELHEQLSSIPKNIEPDLLGALFDYHRVAQADEELKAILTLNYDSLAEDALLRSHGAYDYVIKCQSIGTREASKVTGVPVLKLHGSFDWKKDFPTKVMERGSKAGEDEILWIPPGVEKRRERYPFSILWGRAQELLDCDLLRIVGCSLSPNDWHLVTLLFGTQRASPTQAGYMIELIDFPNCCEDVRKRYSYLRIAGIMDQTDFVKSIGADLFPSLNTGAEPTEEQIGEIESYIGSGKVNVLERWLRARGENLRLAGSDLATTSGIFKRFIDGGQSG